jgi:hypothetical protein
MLDRRAGFRMLCTDVVEIQWKEKDGCNRRCTANLQDISPSGLGLQVETPLPLLTTLRIRHEREELTGKVKSCVLRETGYFVGVEFEEGCRWSESKFYPRHLVNPRRPRS